MNVYMSYSQQKPARMAFADLAALLRSRSYTVLEPHEFGPGESFPAQGVIENADAVICIIASTGSNQSFELGYCVGNGKPVLLVATEDALLSPDMDGLPYVRWVAGDRDANERRIIDWLSELNSTAPTAGKTDRWGVKLLDACREAPAILNGVSRRDFEAVIEDLFRTHGYRVEAAETDSGYDFAVHGYRNAGLTLFEAKKLPAHLRVAIDSVQELISSVETRKATHGVIVSPSGFSPSAIRLARSAAPKVELWSLGELLREADELKQPA
jgi:hypothetical protein